LKVSSISLGSALFGKTISKKEAFELMDIFQEQGGNFIDTAHIYSDWLPGDKSISEKTIGQWLKEKNNRNKLVIGTKGAHPDFSNMYVSRLSKAAVASDLEGSLRALQTDYIDLYWLHRDDEKRPVAEILEYLNEFVKAGKILSFGCSNWKAGRIAEALEYAEKNGMKAFVGNQNMWSYAEPNLDNFPDKTLVAMNEETRKLHLTTGLAAIPFSSQANGFFSKLEENNMSEQVGKLYYNEENAARFERAKKVSKNLGINISDVVLGYLISQPFVTIPVVGCRTKLQLEDSLKASDLNFDKATLQYLENGVVE
jgi:aryl-alcohol dehydrogenase-like predicted oxidoreductase